MPAQENRSGSMWPGLPHELSESMRKNAESILMGPPSASETTSSRPAVALHGSSIGTLPSASGAAASATQGLAREAALALAALSERDLNRMVEDIRKACLGSRVEPMETWEQGESRLVGYCAYRGATADDLDRCARELAPFMERCPVEIAAQELARLGVACVPRRDDGDQGALRAAVFVDLVTPYPADAVIWACRDWADYNTFFPAWAELRQRLESRVKRRRALARFCAEHAALRRQHGGPLSQGGQPYNGDPGAS